MSDAVAERKEGGGRGRRRKEGREVCRTQSRKRRRRGDSIKLGGC